MRRAPIAAIAFALVAGSPGVAIAAGWSAPTTQTVYTVSRAPLSGASASGLTLSPGTLGTKDYPMRFEDGSYLYVPASTTNAQLNVQTTAASTDRQKAYFLSSGYAQIQNLTMAPPTISGEKKLYVMKGLFSSAKVSGANAVPRNGANPIGAKVNGTETFYARGGSPPHYLITGGSGSNRTGTWSQSGSSLIFGLAIVGYWRDGSTTRWKAAVAGFQGVDGQSSFESVCATGTGVSTEQMQVYLPDGITQANTTAPYAVQAATFGVTTVHAANFYWYFDYTVDSAAFDSWWDGGSADHPSEADYMAVLSKSDGSTESWSSGGSPPSSWVTVTVPATPSIDASETSSTAGLFGSDRIGEVWDGIWARIAAVLANFTDWFWFLKVWDLETGWQ